VAGDGRGLSAARMACPGCAVAPFYAIEDAIQIYQLDAEPFLDELLTAINDSD
jgi:hypothetical protein